MRIRWLFAFLCVGCAHTTAADREQGKIHYDIAVAEMQKGDLRAALRDLLTAVKHNPDLPQAHNGLGLVYHSLGRREDALEHYQRAVELKPDFSDAHNNLGILLVDLGRYDEAIVAFKKALDDILYPTPSLPEGNMGWAFHKKGDTATGVKHLENAVATNPKFCRGYEWLARIGLDSEEPARTVEACGRFDKYCLNDAQIAKQLPVPYRQEMGYYCGLGYLKSGDRDAARQAFQSCAEPQESSASKRCAESLQGLP